MNFKLLRLCVCLSLVLIVSLVLIYDIPISFVRAATDPPPAPEMAAGKSEAVAGRFNDLPGKRAADGRVQELPQGTTGPAAIANGDFENGRDGSWYEYSLQGWDIIVNSSLLTVPPHSGKWAAWLGGASDEDSFIEQVVTIPVEDPSLQYWNWITSDDVCGYDTAEVVVSGTVLQSFSLCEDSSTGGWVKRKVDLSPYAGQTVFLSFSAVTDSNLNSNFFVDDVSIETAPPPTAEPTALPTPEPTPESQADAYLPIVTNEYSAWGQCRYDEGVPIGYYPIDSPFISHSVVIDGKISSAGEWSKAFCVDLRMHEGVDAESPNVTWMRWWVQNDGRYMYYLARMPDYPLANGVAADYFWPEIIGGFWPYSDGVYVNDGGRYIDMANWDEEQWYEDIELSPPGTVDVKAAVVKGNGYYWFEIRKDLDSGDRWDWAVQPGDTVGYSPNDSFLFAYIFEDGFYSRSARLHIGEP